MVANLQRGQAGSRALTSQPRPVSAAAAPPPAREVVWGGLGFTLPKARCRPRSLAFKTAPRAVTAKRTTNAQMKTI